MKLLICNKAFNTKKALKSYIDDVLSRWPAYVPIEGDDMLFLKELITKYHPMGNRYESIKTVTTEWDGNYKRIRVELQDGTYSVPSKNVIVNFCNTPSEERFTKYLETKITQVMRHVVSMHSTMRGMHMHHSGKTFDQIQHDWLESRGLKLSDVHIPMEIEHTEALYFTDPDLQTDWVEYHNSNAKFERIPKSEHYKKHTVTKNDN